MAGPVLQITGTIPTATFAQAGDMRHVVQSMPGIERSQPMGYCRSSSLGMGLKYHHCKLVYSACFQRAASMTQ